MISIPAPLSLILLLIAACSPVSDKEEIEILSAVDEKNSRVNIRGQGRACRQAVTSGACEERVLTSAKELPN